MLDILVIAPHPDDAELGMGGAIVKFLNEGKKVGILDLTDGEPTPHGSIEIRAQETTAASKALGVEWRENLGLTNRKLTADLDSRAALANVIRRTRPKWLFAPFWTDAHPDHVAATQLVEDARFWAKLTKSELAGEPFHPERIYNYYSIHLKLAIQPAFVLDITQEWPSKLASLKAYHSQLVKGREHMQPSMMDRFRDWAAYWGQMIGTEFGEPFASREPLALQSMNDLF